MIKLRGLFPFFLALCLVAVSCSQASSGLINDDRASELQHDAVREMTSLHSFRSLASSVPPVGYQIGGSWETLIGENRSLTRVLIVKREDQPTCTTQDDTTECVPGYGDIQSQSTDETYLDNNIWAVRNCPLSGDCLSAWDIQPKPPIPLTEQGPPWIKYVGADLIAIEIANELRVVQDEVGGKIVHIQGRVNPADVIGQTLSVHYDDTTANGAATPQESAFYKEHPIQVDFWVDQNTNCVQKLQLSGDQFLPYPEFVGGVLKGAGELVHADVQVQYSDFDVTEFPTPN